MGQGLRFDACACGLSARHAICPQNTGTIPRTHRGGRRTMPQDDTQHGPTGRPASDAAQGSPPDDHPHPPPRSHWLRWTIIAVVAGGAVVVALIFGIPWLIDYFHTVSTDDAFVGGHVSMISARVTGHVTAVRVENNDRVRKGDLLMELDPQPYQVAVNQKRAAGSGRGQRERGGRRGAAPRRPRPAPTGTPSSAPRSRSATRRRRCTPSWPTSGSRRPTSTSPRKRRIGSASWRRRTRPRARSWISASPTSRWPSSAW